MIIKKILLILLSIILILLAAICVLVTLHKANSAQEAKQIVEEPIILPIITKTEAVIISVGDIFIHQSNLDSAFDKKTNTYNFDDTFLPVANYFQEADFSTAWLGGVIDTKGPYTGYPSFKSPVSLVETLKNIGLDAVFRTNHTLDFGTKGFETTTKILEENNINQIAAHTTEENSKNIFVYQKDNLKIAFLGYIYGMNGIPIPKTWMINLIDLEKIEADIKKAKEQSDFIVVALHFGNEYERFPSQWQKNIVQKIADFGADMIIGSHPHVLQPTDIITTLDNRKVFVAYGLGNFFCGQRQHYTDSGIMLKYTIEKIGEETKLKEINYIPTWVAKYKENNKYQFKILPSKKYLDLYTQNQASFLSLENYKHLLETYQETIKHLNNLEIGFIETE
ncbi:MAG: CapA family protein [Patescibacteria group bacterium]